MYLHTISVIIMCKMGNMYLCGPEVLHHLHAFH